MRRAIIGCFLSLIGAIGIHASFVVVGNNFVSGWGTPPGRFLTTISETGMTGPMVIASTLIVTGFIIMSNEYRRED